jgi:hypothetical protein
MVAVVLQKVIVVSIVLCQNSGSAKIASRKCAQKKPHSSFLQVHLHSEHGEKLPTNV